MIHPLPCKHLQAQMVTTRRSAPLMDVVDEPAGGDPEPVVDAAVPVTEEKKPVNKVVGLGLVFLTLFAAGSIMNFAFSPRSPFMQ